MFNSKLINLYLPLAAVAFMLTAGWYLTISDFNHFLPPCLFDKIFHRDCPACGLTTSFLNTSQGHFRAAFTYNFAGPILYLGFFVYLVEIVTRLFKENFRLKIPSRVWNIYIVLVIVCLLGQWGVKMIFFH